MISRVVSFCHRCPNAVMAQFLSSVSRYNNNKFIYPDFNTKNSIYIHINNNLIVKLERDLQRACARSVESLVASKILN